MKQFLFCGLLSLFYLSSSSQRSGQTDTFLFTKFPAEKSLHFETAFPVKKDFVRKVFLTDTSVITWSVNEDRSFFFRPYSLNGQRKPGGYIRSGRGEGKIASPLSGGRYKDTYWLFDISANKVVTARTQSNIAGRDTVILEEYSTPDFYYSTALTDSLQLLGAGVYDATFKLARIDLQTGQTIRIYGSFDNPPADIPFNSWKESFQSVLYTRSGKDVAVLACRYTDQVEFINMITGNSRIIKGPENHPPQYSPLFSGDRDVIERTAETRFAFSDGAVTDKYIYLIYSGNHEVEGAGNLNGTGKMIYVYDWQGMPVRKLIVNKAVSCITVTADDSMLYAYDPETEAIVKTKINL